jgi:cytochrome c oxidase subunit 2
MNFKNAMSAITRKLVCGIVLVGALLSSFVLAQTREQEHAIDPNPQSQVHAYGSESKEWLPWRLFAPPEDISTMGYKIDWLFQYTTWVTFAFFLMMAGALLYYIVQYRQAPGHEPFYTHGLGKKHQLATRILDLSVFLSLDLVLMVASYTGARDVFMNYPKGDDVVRIQVMPQQWAWNFKYAGSDNQFGTADDINTNNSMWVPKGRPVLVQMKAKDVIHGLFIPNIRMQVDALPGHITRLWFEATKTGDFEIACAHMCGTAHYKMKAFLRVVEAEDYDSWIQEMSEWSAAKYDPNEANSKWGWNWGITEVSNANVKATN